jgi:4-hydroxy-3-methylbut-2-enyl diphosphate reductase
MSRTRRVESEEETGWEESGAGEKPRKIGSEKRKRHPRRRMGLLRAVRPPTGFAIEGPCIHVLSILELLSWVGVPFLAAMGSRSSRDDTPLGRRRIPSPEALLMCGAHFIGLAPVVFGVRLLGMTTEQTYFRSGFGLKERVRPQIDAEYQSALVEEIRSRGYTMSFGRVTARLAEEFGFCYGVDRAIDYAYETRNKFPDRTVFLVGEIIHNPHVNQRMRDMGIRFLYADGTGKFDFSVISEKDVVILPAFGVTLAAFEELKAIGCILVDTTCGSVLLVWKRVEGYARDGFTSVIHGKFTHEESRATASQVEKHPGGKYLIVRDMEEARLISDYIAGRPGHVSREQFLAHFINKTSPDFDPDRDLARFGVANQTTMLANESMAIGRELEKALAEGNGREYAEANYRSFGTICSATQERQDAVLKMMEQPPEVMIVIGGYNSSNTNHLAHMCREYTRTFHIEDSVCIDVETGKVRHKPELAADAPEVLDIGWLPEGPFQLGITAGASTPNNKIGDTLLRVLQILDIPVEAERAPG